VFTEEDYQSKDGFLTSVWGPCVWHFLHTTSFNYPIEPTEEDKKHYMDLITNLQFTLPCKYCRMNLTKNLKELPLTMDEMKNRDSFSRYVYNLHEHINKMLNKKSGLTYEDVRERYEHFRARCLASSPKSGTRKKKELGCTQPLYGKKARCIIKIIPHENKCPTFQIDKKCIKRR
ncbi:MAG: Erv1/Alr family FAD-linked sulfhydryl oxidase, partial [Crocinitomicaceae bacterium]|nr:Erv1/Alr family FAD-linked sulfhydryl oxidase [Crocinitomicaceae bacterium]